jgi:hypothetical protein
MRYKNNVLEKLGQTDIAANRIQIQVSRGSSQSELLSSIETLKETIENIREMISIEPDDFAQQFASRQ